MASSQAQTDGALGAAAAAEAVPVPASPSADASAHQILGLQSEIEHLRESVRMLIEAAGERDARDQLEQERAASKEREELEDGNDALPPQETPAAPAASPQAAPAAFIPVRQAQPQQFHVSPGAAGTEWGGSPTPAGAAAAQGWSAYNWTNDAGRQDPWTHSADPWTSWSSGWHQQDWRG